MHPNFEPSAIRAIRRNRAFAYARTSSALYTGRYYATRLALSFASGAIAGVILALAIGLISPGSSIYIGPHFLPYP